MSIKIWMDKEVVLQKKKKKEVVFHIHSEILAIKRNAFESVLMRWMNLEPIIQSEVSQKEKDKYRILAHIYWRSPWFLTSILWPGKSHGRRSLEGFAPWGRWGTDTTERLHFHFSLSCIGEGNGNPLQCSCLENPRDGGALWAAVYGVAQSWTQLKWLSSSSSTYIWNLEKWYWWVYLQGSNGETDRTDLRTWEEGRRGWDVWRE